MTHLEEYRLMTNVGHARWKWVNAQEHINLEVYLLSLLGYKEVSSIVFSLRTLEPNEEGEIMVRGELGLREHQAALPFVMGIPEVVLIMNDEQSLKCLADLKRAQINKGPSDD